MEIKLKLNGENVVLNISDVTVNGKPVDIDNNEQLNAPEFKDGDFCCSKNGKIYYIFIFKSKINSDKSKYNEALNFYKSNNLTYAKEICNDILNEDKTNSNALYLIGAILNKQDDKYGAVNFLKKAIKSNPSHMEANE